MSRAIHLFYVGFLFILGIMTVVMVGIYGGGYYLTSFTERPYHPLYDLLKPSGNFGHGYGIIGSAMIIFGVILYSSRKRIRRFSDLGRIKYYLEFHIFLCLVGPILVLYHTTFKFGGLVAVSFWSMTAVVLSGIIGRYLYTQIPKGIHGNELSINEIMEENKKLSEILQKDFGLSLEWIQYIDTIGALPKPPAEMSLAEVLRFALFGDFARRRQMGKLFNRLRKEPYYKKIAKQMKKIAGRRIALIRRIAMLEQLKQIFHYWHVIHLPFSIIMFIILFIHVGVALTFGYTWIW